MADLACPFYQHDPNISHVDPCYEVCGSSSWSTMEEVIDHLHTKHRVYVCQRCLDSFPTVASRRAHEKNCIVPLPLARGETWQRLYRKLFSNTPPLSSYKANSRQDTSSAAPPPPPASRHNTRFHPYSRAPAAGRTSNASNPPPASAQNPVLQPGSQAGSQAHPDVQTNANQFGVESAQGPASQTIAPVIDDIPPSSRTDTGSDAPVQYPASVHQHQLPPIRESSSFNYRRLPSIDDLQRNIQLNRNTDANVSNTNSESNNGQAADSQLARYHIAGRRKSQEVEDTMPSSSSGPNAGSS